MKLWLYVLKLKLLNRKRGSVWVDSEYNSGIYNKRYEDINFEKGFEVYEHSYDELGIFQNNGKLVKLSYANFYESYQRPIIAILEFYVNESIVELGCGLGTWLIQLQHMNFKKLEGYDVSKNVISNAKRYTTEKNYKIHFDVLDLTKPFPKGIIENKVVFTHACLSLLKPHMSNILKEIIDGKPKIVINFEVDFDSAPFIVKQYSNVLNSQNNLVKELKKLERDNKIEIISIKKLPLSAPLNPVSAITWKIKE